MGQISISQGVDQACLKPLNFSHLQQAFEVHQERLGMDHILILPGVNRVCLETPENYCSQQAFEVYQERLGMDHISTIRAHEALQALTPTPHTPPLHPTSSIHPHSQTLHPRSYTLHPTPCTLHLQPYTRNPIP